MTRFKKIKPKTIMPYLYSSNRFDLMMILLTNCIQNGKELINLIFCHQVEAHTSCQQELEKIQWDKENFLLENEKRWKELENQKKSGLILDVVRKDKALAYSFNC